MLVGSAKPVARISFVKKFVFVTFTTTGADTATFPAGSRAEAVNVCAPLATERLSQDNA